MLSDSVNDVIEGTADAGAFNVKFAVLVPIVEEPFSVTTVIVPVPEVALGIWVSSERGGVQDADVVAAELIVPVDDPNLYVTTCVNAVEARGRLIVMVAPASSELGDNEG